MNMTTIHFIRFLSAQGWVGRLGWALVHFLWQGVLIAAVYALARRWVGSSRSAQARYLLACAALVALVAAPIVTFCVGGASDSAAANPYIGRVPLTSTGSNVEAGSAAALPVRVTRAWRDEVMPWIAMVWFVGAIGFWVRMVGGWVVAARMRSMLVRPAPLEWQRTLDRIRSRVRVSRPVRLLVSGLIHVPTVAGWLRPVVLVPVGALAGLPVEYVEAFLAHELAHIRRHDYLVNILQSVAEALLFYHPAVWWVSKHIRNEREHCCDDLAVTVAGDALSYARALADLESGRPAHFTPALAADGGSLPERIGRLLGMPARRSRPMPGPGVLVAAIVIVVTTYGLFAQQAVHPSFEVVSIKPNDLGGGHSGEHTTPGRFTASMTTRALIRRAFDIKDFQVSGGPGWLDNDNYDIVATTAIPVRLTTPVLGPLLQSLLADRYRFKYHREMKEFPVYLLMPAKKGPKLKMHTGDRGEGTSSQGGKDKVTMTGTKLSMAAFASYLAREMDRPVIDKTGITGEYDVALEWSPEQAEASSGPSIFTALEEQFGLRLESGKGPVEILVVDSVEKPSEN
jgi:uncharacterized protein (TIGR03435 family)